MSQRVRKNGSPTSNCSGASAGSPSGSPGISAAGVSLLGRLLPMKATVPFQLKTQTQHPLQSRTVLSSTGNAKCHSSGTHSRSPTRSLSSCASNVSAAASTSSAPSSSSSSSPSSSSSRTSPIIAVHASNPRASHAQVPVPSSSSSPYTAAHLSPQCCSSDTSALTSSLSASPSSSSSLWSCAHRAKPLQTPEHDRLSPERLSPSSPVCTDKHRLPVAGSWYTTSNNGSIRRTSSLDALTAPYLSGHWPRDANHAPCAPCMRDKSTQTPSAWADECEEKKRGCHKRSASCGSTDQLKEIVKLRQQLQRSKHSCRHHRDKERKSPFNGNHAAFSQSQAPIPKSVLISIPISKSSVSRFRNSVEGLNQEIERIIVRDTGDREEQIIPQEAPDGHRAPPPLCQRSASSRSIDTQTPLGTAAGSNHSNSSSRSQSISPTFLNMPSEPCSDSPSPHEDEALADGHEKDLAPSSPLPKYASSPKPNNSYMFKREPPEGCERVKVFTEETQARPPREIPQFLCPDRNKVNFIPKSGSAFCLVSIPKTLMPTQELNNIKNQSAAHLTPEPEPRVSRRTCMLSQQPSGSSSCLSES
ncbi:protein FAM117B [Sinocyclocheilus grahami]|uniref:Protein FAM117B-like n=1 Tax=Sinocyclocheilus grahami TaxID=75366 RepID=A0A672T9Y4_SINGR|nr:PREDICTED: protein FAM117B-like [Sinocyclocheilus grahami]